jgi:hypothetical protein
LYSRAIAEKIGVELARADLQVHPEIQIPRNYMQNDWVAPTFVEWVEQQQVAIGVERALPPEEAIEEPDEEADAPLPDDSATVGLLDSSHDPAPDEVLH